MKAMVLRRTGPVPESGAPLEPAELPDPEPSADQVLIRVSTCGVCHTELDEIEGRMAPPVLPVVPGHQVVGRVEAMGPDAGDHAVGDRVGVGWIASSCGVCRFCKAGDDNLCPYFRATGRDVNGGYAELMTIRQGYAFPVPASLSDSEAAPLLCAGAIGYRSLRLTGLQDGDALGLTGFGASGHLVLQMARRRFPRSRVYVFARSGAQRDFAKELGASWAGDTTESSPEKLAAVIDTTPVWRPVVEALRNLAPGGRLVVNAIRKEDADKEALLGLDYAEHLWMEREIKTVANVAPRDIREFLELAARADIRPECREFDLAEANEALRELKTGSGRGAKVLRVGR